jgi:hypothetical protein
MARLRGTLLFAEGRFEVVDAWREKPANQPDPDVYGTTDCRPSTRGEHVRGLRLLTTSIRRSAEQE